MIISDDEVMIVDYKTNRPSPTLEEDNGIDLGIQSLPTDLRNSVLRMRSLIRLNLNLLMYLSNFLSRKN